MTNIYPHFNYFESREQKERQLYQHGVTIWFTGLSGSGKSVVAAALEHLLTANGYLSTLLDGDNLRSGLNADLGFSESDRVENIRRTAEVCRLMNNCAIITLATLVSPTEAMRTLARRIIGEQRFVTIYISTPLDVCEHRDPKGLYRRARQGEVTDFTGISAPFEAPKHSDIELDTTNLTDIECAERIFATIKSKIEYEL